MGDEAFIGFVATAISLCALLVSLLTLWWQLFSQKNKEFAGVAIAALNSAFSALTNDQPGVLPMAVRTSWIESARQIELYKSIRSKVTSKEYLEICNQAESAVCHKFYAALRRIPVQNTDYFTNDVQLYPGNERHSNSIGLDPLSVAVVFSFGFRSQKIDPLDSINVSELFTDNNALTVSPALKLFLENSGVLEKSR